MNSWTDPFCAFLTFTRIYSGTIKKGDTILNSFTGKTERVSRMVEMHADDRNEVDTAQAGDIVAIVGLKNVQTGHTLCDEKHPATLKPMVFPDPVISIAVAAKDKANAEKLSNAISKMVQEDPSFRVETDEETYKWRRVRDCPSLRSRLLRCAANRTRS